MKDEKIETLKRMYVDEKKSTKEIGKYFGVTSKTIREWLHKNNILVRQSSEINRKYALDEEYFFDINTETKSYLLGFICADGYLSRNRYGGVNTIGLAVKEEDVEVINLLQTELKTNTPLRCIEKNKTIELRVCSVKMARHLKLKGVEDNKSLTLNIEEVIEKSSISQELIPYFLLGYFDGDGGIYKYLGSNGKTYQYSMSITGTRETCNYFYRFFEGVGFMTKRNKESDTNNYTYVVSGKNLTRQCLDKLYSTNYEHSLKRKKEKYLELKSPAT